MSTILEDIETKIAGLKTSTTRTNVGVVREIGDGVASIEGLERRHAQRNDRVSEWSIRSGAEPRRK